MKRSARQHALIDHLRARAPRPVSATRLAQRFGVSRRTIERDLVALRDAGVPLYAVDGRAGGHSILSTYSLPPLNLDLDEAWACAIALDLLDESPFGTAAARARDRLIAALPSTVREAARTTAVPVERVRGPGLHLLPAAIATGEVVRLTYRGETREVEPLRLLHASGGWYLIGWNRPDGGVRGFRMDRIEGVERTRVLFRDRHEVEVGADLARWTRVSAGGLG